MNQSGHIFYQDEFEQIYRLDWETINGVIDLTSIVMQPYVWGEPSDGYITNGIRYKRGVITVERQALRVYDGGYEIVASGISQYVDFIQLNFPCQEKPLDTFAYHFNHNFTEEVDFVTTFGPHWANPDEDDDDTTIWAELDSSGTPITTPTVTVDILEFIDVWS
jgi:hypothetical protein